MNLHQNEIYFSIIIPTLNSEGTLVTAIESVLDQTYPNFELLILDAFSQDETVNIVHKFQARHPNIIFIQQHDEGIYDAMNKGIDLAKGNWLYFMGSDDKLYTKNVLKKIATSNLVTEVDVIYGNVFSTRFNGIYDGEFTYQKLAYKNICHQAIFFKKSLFRKIGKFNLKYISHADYDHNIRWFFSSKIKKAYINLIIADYADGGFSSVNPDKKFEKDKNLKLLRLGYSKLKTPPLLKILRILFSKNPGNLFSYEG